MDIFSQLKPNHDPLKSHATGYLEAPTQIHRVRVPEVVLISLVDEQEYLKLLHQWSFHAFVLLTSNANVEQTPTTEAITISLLEPKLSVPNAWSGLRMDTVQLKEFDGDARAIAD